MLREIVLCVLVSLSQASVLKPDLRSSWRSFSNQCPPKPPTISTFDLEAYLGIWYEQKRIPRKQQLDTTCVRADYGLTDEGIVTVHNVATLANGTLYEVFGTAYCPDPNYPGELLVDFPQSPVDGNYWILDTDYETYSVVYSCVDIIVGLVYSESAWILSRAQNLDPALIQKGVDLLASYQVDVSIMEDTVQNADCYYGD